VIKMLNFLFFIFLVRELSISQYGVYVLVWSQVNFFTPLLDFGTTSYGLVYMDEKKKTELNSLLSLRLVLAVVIFIATVISGFIYTKEQTMPLYVFLTSFAVFGNVMYGSFVIIMSLRQRAYLASLYSLIFTVLLVTASSLAIFYTQSLHYVFLVIFVMYNLNAIICWFNLQHAQGSFKFTFRPGIWREIVSKSYVFVLISFFLGVYFKIDIFLLKFLKSESEVGIYSAGYKFFESLLFIIGSYNISATPQLAKLYNESSKKFLERIKKDSIFLFSIGCVIAFCTYFIAPMLLSVVLKQSSLASAHVLQIVIISLPFMLLSAVVTNALYILRKAHIIIYVYIAQILLNTVLNFIFIPQFSYLASAYITVLNELLNVATLFLLFYFYKRDENKR
ncbi:MAG: oligosaccharide flippase family protein, partial [Patescibacteria group bacterium]